MNSATLALVHEARDTLRCGIDALARSGVISTHANESESLLTQALGDDEDPDKDPRR